MSDASPLSQAIGTLSLSPQEQNLYLHHLNNLHGDGKVVQKNGDISTLLQAVVSGPGGYYNIPTVWEGKELSVPEKKAERTVTSSRQLRTVSQLQQQASAERQTEFIPYGDTPGRPRV